MPRVINIADPKFDYDDKVGVWTGNREDDVIVRRSTRVPYFDGEV